MLLLLGMFCPVAASDPSVADYAGPLQTLQAFDGPIPETFNGRLCMLAVPIALLEEWFTGSTMSQQVSAHPERIVGISLLILIATCAPILRWAWLSHTCATARWLQFQQRC